MTAFPIIALDASPRSCGIVVVIVSHMDNGGHLRPIVAGHDYQRVVGNSQLIQSPHEFADNVVEFENEITVGTGLGFPFEVSARK